jgi:hypothetical protein
LIKTTLTIRINDWTNALSGFFTTLLFDATVTSIVAKLTTGMFLRAPRWCYVSIAGAAIELGMSGPTNHLNPLPCKE